MIKLGLDTAADANAKVARFPLPECTAMSQGYIGYHLQNGILRQLRLEKMPWHVATVVTQMEVDPADPAFRNPTKPIGAFYTEDEAKRLMAENPGMSSKRTPAADGGRWCRRRSRWISWRRTAS
jgi:carbamate kinase